jgi:hypothetical protein
MMNGKVASYGGLISVVKNPPLIPEKPLSITNVSAICPFLLLAAP